MPVVPLVCRSSRDLGEGVGVSQCCGLKASYFRVGFFLLFAWSLLFFLASVRFAFILAQVTSLAWAVFSLSTLAEEKQFTCGMFLEQENG